MTAHGGIHIEEKDKDGVPAVEPGKNRPGYEVAAHGGIHIEVMG